MRINKIQIWMFLIGRNGNQYFFVIGPVIQLVVASISRILFPHRMLDEQSVKLRQWIIPKINNKTVYSHVVYS